MTIAMTRFDIQRTRFLRHDAHRFVRHDAQRFLRPACKHLLPPGSDPLDFFRLLEGKANFNPNQPRVPKGNPDGGQWTSEGGDNRTVDDGSDLSGDSESPVQLAYLGPAVAAGRVVVQKGIEAGLALFTWLSTGNGPDGTAVLELPAEEFRSDADPSALVHVGRLTEEELSRACPRVGEVQSLTDTAAASVRREDYDSPQTYGTAVHTRLRNEVRALHDPDFVAEVSLLKTLEETGMLPEETVRYGQLGSIRLDILENAGAGTVCVYDIKTGVSGLTRKRIVEIARSVYARFPTAQRIIVTETRPRR